MPKPNNKNHKKKFTPPPAPSLTPTWRIELPLDDPCQIYPRVSTPEQKKNVSAEMQKDKSFAISCGWREDLIILDDRDLGVSGQILMEDREAFNDMLRRIAKGKIKAVVVVNVDRLFRDKWGAESGKFMEICHTYGVIIVTPDFVYDFRISWHIERFKRRCEEAWNYVEYHIYGRMLPARDRRGYAGFWAGGNVPMGYIVDIQEKINGAWNPHYLRYTLYEPHAETIRWIFKRFRELHGNVHLLLVEIKKKPYLFRDFDDTLDPVSVQASRSCCKVEGGYTIISGRGIRYLLTNRIYIGQWVYQQKVVELNIENYPPAIVDLDTFTYAYEHLSKTKLDGTPNQQVLEVRGKRYAKKHFSDRPAILKEVIFAADTNFRVYTKNHKTAKGTRSYYYITPPPDNRNAEKDSPICTIVASGVDAIVLERLREHMQRPEVEADYQNFIAVEQEVIDETSETLKDIERDIAATKALMARTLEQIKSGKFTDPDLAAAANNSYIAAKQDLERLEQRREDTANIANEDQERKIYKELMQEVESLWDDKEIIKPEDHPRLVYLFIESVTLDLISPSFFTVTVKWKDPEWGIDKGVCYKGEVVNCRWTDEEKAIIEARWLSATRQELLALLPRRSYIAMFAYMYDRKDTTNMRRPNSQYLEVPRSICLEDWKVMQEYGITEARIKEWGNVKLIRWA